MKTIKIPNIMGKTWEQAKGEVYQTLVYLIQRLRTTGLQEEENASGISSIAATIPENLDDLADVDVTGAADKSTIRLNTTSGHWEDVILSFANLSDVDMDPGPNDNDIPRYDSGSSTWLPEALSLSSISDIDLTGIANGDFLRWDDLASKLAPYRTNVYLHASNNAGEVEAGFVDAVGDIDGEPSTGDTLIWRNIAGVKRWRPEALDSWYSSGWRLKDAGISDATAFSLFTITKLAALDAVALSIEFWGYAYDATDISTCVGKIQHTDLFRSGAWGAAAFPTLVGVDDYELRTVSSGGTVAPSFTVTASGDDLTIKATLTKAGGWTPSFKFRYRVSMATTHVPSFAF